jgi:hypothetical protein
MNAHSLQQMPVRRISQACRWLVWCALGLIACQASAEKIYYSLDNVWFQEDGESSTEQMHGYFSWTYTQGDFENGTGVFHYMDIPGTAHDHTDLLTTIEPGAIEITLDANVHDDGVDITFKFLTPLTPTGTSVIDTEADPAVSKFDIGGNGFYKGTIVSGSVAPFEFKLSIETTTPTTASVSWTPDYPGAGVLQESPTLAPPAWVNAAIGNPLNVNTTGTKMFYQLVLP